MSFAQVATNPFAHSQVYKDRKDCLSTQVGHPHMHKSSPKPPGTLLQVYVSGYELKAGAMTGLFQKLPSLSPSHWTPIEPSCPCLCF